MVQGSCRGDARKALWKLLIDPSIFSSGIVSDRRM
jgi:hypothetical protein